MSQGLAHRCFDAWCSRVARFHPALCALLVRWFQPASELCRIHRFGVYHWPADWLDVDNFGTRKIYNMEPMNRARAQLQLFRN
jgi:hypothetical protein